MRLPHDEEPDQPGRARVRIDARSMEWFMALPDDMRVVAVIATHDPVGFDLVVEHKGLPKVPPFAESPVAHLRWRVGQDEHGQEVAEYEIVWPEGSNLHGVVGA